MTQKSISIDWLKGKRVLLIAHYIPGGMASYLLRHLGAEIIKVEPPHGELMRQMPPFLKGEEGNMNAYFRAFNAGVKSIVVDFKSTAGAETLRKLIAVSDVLIDGNRVGLIEKVIGGKIHASNPEIIHIPVTGQGIKGPLKDIAAHDNNCLARSGALSFTPLDEEGLPSVFSGQIADITAGYMAAFMAVSALMGKANAQSQSTVGTIDASMLHSAFFLNQMYVSAMNVTQQPPQPKKEALNGGLANYRMYKTADSQAIFFGPLEPKLFNNFCTAINRPDLPALLMRENDQLIDELKHIFSTKTRAEWAALLKACDCCFTEVNNLEEAMNDPQIQALGLVREVADKNLGNLNLVTFPAGFGEDSLPPTTTDSAPEIGEHTEWVHREILGK